MISLKEHIYGFTGTGRLTQIGHQWETEEDLYPVGGKIYYINPNSTEEVEFFDEYGDPIENVTVGSTPYAYRKVHEDPNGIDKYYVYYDTLYTSKIWAPSAYQSTSLGGTDTAIGTGKTNTKKAMEAESGAYVVSGTVWYQIKAMRDNLYGGCDDWFLPSRQELEELRKAIGFVKQPSSDPAPEMTPGPVTGGSIAGVADGQTHSRAYDGNTTYYPSATKFIDNYIWTSSESSATNSWIWNYYDQAMTDTTKSNNFCVVGVRAF